MDQSPRTTGSLRQQPLQFPAIPGRVGPWNGLTEQQRQECRQAIRQLLVAVVRHAPSTLDDHRGFVGQGPEVPTHD
jgi:hypothetical protein